MCNAGMYLSFNGSIITKVNNYIKHNGVNIATISNTNNNDVLYSINFTVMNTTKQQVLDVLKAVTFDKKFGLENNWNIDVTIYDGNTGAQGSGGELNSVYNIQINPPAGTIIYDYCNGGGGYTYITSTADGNGGVNSVYDDMSYSCGYHDWIRTSLLQSNNKILLFTANKNNGNISGDKTDDVLARINTDGTLDTTFATNGYYSFNNSYNAKDVKLLTDNKIAFITRTGAINKLEILSNNGVLLTSTNNKPTGYPNFSNELLIPIANDVNLIFGYYNGGGADYRGVITKVNNSGVIDVAFNTFLNANSNILHTITTTLENIKFHSATNKLYIYSGDKIVRMDYTGNDVSIDTTYGVNGTFTNNGSNFKNIIFQTNGKIVALSNYRIIRINTDGTLDTSFSTNGLMDVNDLSIHPEYGCEFFDIKLLSNGNMYVLWYGHINVNTTIANNIVTKCLSNGSIDTTYGDSGHAVLPLAFDSYDVYATDYLQIRNDDLAIVCSSTDGNRSYRFTLTGVLDGTY